MTYKEKINKIKNTTQDAQLIVVTKNQSFNKIKQIYNLGERDFGENRVQTLIEKYKILPKDIKWHMIGHLQTNKVKYITPFIHLIQSVDSLKLLKKINESALTNKRKVNCLLQVKISNEKSKYGFETKEVTEILSAEHKSKFTNVDIQGIMGMGSLTNNSNQIRREFEKINQIFRSLNPNKKILSIGMSNDYQIAYKAGSNMIRIGSYIFNN